MKKYFIQSDIHGCYTYWMKSLEEKGFDKENKEHFLIVIGDLFDRGRETNEIIEFVKEMKDRIILIKGNHEDNLVFMIERGYPDEADYYNGTVRTVVDLFGDKLPTLDELYEKPIYKDVIDKMVNYYETKNHIFTHGFIPVKYDIKENVYTPIDNWRNAKEFEWVDARWNNGMKIGEGNFKDIENNTKKYVVGHVHASYGHQAFEGGSFDDYSIFYGKKVIGIDACTIISKRVNILVLTEEEI